MFIPSEKTPASKLEMKRILSEEERTTAGKTRESIEDSFWTAKDLP